MNIVKTKKSFTLFTILISLFLIFTLFMPTIRIDRYIEYDFNYGYYNENYSSYSEPIASKISTGDVISTLFIKRSDLNKVKTKFLEEKKVLDNKLLAGEISKEEYTKLLASSKTTSTYYLYATYFGSEEVFKPIQGKIFLYSLVFLIFYIVLILIIVFNLFYYFNRKKLLSIATVFTVWIEVFLLIISIVYTFSMAVLSKNQIEGFEGNIMEEVSTCYSPNWVMFLILAIFVVLGFITTLLDHKDSEYLKQRKELPSYIPPPKQTNKYRKINYKRGYKNVSKKKRYR